MFKTHLQFLKTNAHDVSRQGHALRGLAWLASTEAFQPHNMTYYASNSRVCQKLLNIMINAIRGEGAQRETSRATMVKVAGKMLSRAQIQPSFSPCLLEFSITWPREAPNRCDPVTLGRVWCACARVRSVEPTWRSEVLKVCMYVCMCVCVCICLCASAVCRAHVEIGGFEGEHDKWCICVYIYIYIYMPARAQSFEITWRSEMW
jgi:hypothetical protein